MRKILWSVMLVLAAASPGLATEWQLVGEQVAFPAPAAGFERWSADRVGSHRVWVDAQAIDPIRHVVSFVVRAYRSLDGDEPELLAETHTRRGGWLDPLLTPTGATLLRVDRGYVLFPVEEPPVDLGSMNPNNDGFALPVGVWDDGPLAVFSGRLAHDGRRAYEVAFFDQGPDGTRSVLEKSMHERAPFGFVRDGDRFAWLQYPDEQPSPPLVRVASLRDAADTNVPAHTLPIETDSDFRIDGLFGPWLLAHQGGVVRLIHIDDERELELRVPGDVLLADPRGVLFSGGLGAPSDDQRHLVWWDLITGERSHLLAPAVHSRHQRHYEVLSDPPRLLVRQRDAHTVFELDAQVPISNAQAAVAREQLRLIEAAWASGEGRDRAVWNALHQLRWPFARETVPVLTEVLGESQDTNLRRQLARLLGVTSDPRGREVLLELLAAEQDLFVREGMLIGLSSAGDPRDARTIADLDVRTGEVEAVADALGILGDPEVAPWLEERSELSFPHPGQQQDTRQAVARALSLLADRQAALDVLAELRRR